MSHSLLQHALRSAVHHLLRAALHKPHAPRVHVKHVIYVLPAAKRTRKRAARPPPLPRP